ncbi:MAG: RsmE family RNA methyltransferase [Coriobacteriaceae bacterium]|nr:RsmE family RNA methyltransferase [Coriobacteriaceae bacterium]
MAGQTLYLQTQVIACETEEIFALRLDEATLAAALGQGIASGDTIAVVDGAQDYFPCEVIEAGPAGIRVRIAARDDARAARPRVHLVQGLSNDEAMDTIIRQVSELGVAGILPFRSTFSPSVSPARAEELHTRWARLARIAARQAGLPKAPDVGFIEPLSGACETLAGFDAVIVCWEGEVERSMDEAVAHLGLAGRTGIDVALVVGPRGGLTDSEMAAIGGSNEALATVSLGPAILRVETAGLVAPTLLISALGGLR